ncbi:MAG: hypothetical protein Q4C66_03045 [Lachnospiraceae bacterium]|nr:hypothetical protein [Lachnospiraceae bacterium]
MARVKELIKSPKNECCCADAIHVKKGTVYVNTEQLIGSYDILLAQMAKVYWDN